MRRAPTVLIAVAIAWALPDLVRGADDPPVDESVCLQALNRALSAELDLAGAGDAYLVLRPEPMTITVTMRGVALRSFELEAIEVATALAAADEPLALWGGHSGGLVVPAPIERAPEALPLAASSETDEVVLIPLEPAERFPAPPAYRIEFATGLSIEVTTPDTDGVVGGGVFARLLRWFGNEEPDAAGLRIRMTDIEAGDLYRALVPPVAFVVEPACGEP